MAMHPRFSRDFKKLAYVGRDETFLTHSGNYQLKAMSWPLNESDPSSETILDTVKDYPTDDQEYGGLYGYQHTYNQSGFLAESSRFYVISSELKG